MVNFPPLNFERKSGFSASSQFLSMRQFASKNIIMQLDAQIAALQIEERMLLVTPHATCFFFFLSHGVKAFLTLCNIKIIVAREEVLQATCSLQLATTASRAANCTTLLLVFPHH